MCIKLGLNFGSTTLVNWESLSYLYKRRLASIMYQVYHNTLRDYLTAQFETRNSDNKYNLRRINTFSNEHYNSNLGRNSVRYRGAIVWNLIPKAIKDVFPAVTRWNQ